MVRQWRFPDIVQTRDQAVSYLETFRTMYPKDAPIQDDISAAQGLVIEQFNKGGGGPF